MTTCHIGRFFCAQKLRRRFLPVVWKNGAEKVPVPRTGHDFVNACGEFQNATFSQFFGNPMCAAFTNG